MKKKREKKKKIETLEDKLKYEIAEELGLTDKINDVGWGGLTAKESGRIGGLITVRKREMNKTTEEKKE
ncbi:alpha/beta-type small acid-soluble spore protein [Tissierella pigra]|uniref:Small, acid-soluble spore protein, alpha/beta type n=1 Tax=Tissierella pigra TaxID=2607614 RepID=A0A6N7XHB5_9FIRM|nr:small, acid-soluble spore protein, alpha/beta type [Tissierella pigra]MBU5427329.1 alpha/beta-type small acid-soluble spore protein [Tissierella pigra]MSU01419.1 small, acid-soluble spore protein, alpha/beta type [Tissierella pigra]